VLYPQYLSDTLLTQAYAGTFRPLWSEEILNELGRNLRENAHLSQEQVSHRLGRMRRAFPDAGVSGYEALVDSMTNDVKDRHVLAAAVRANVEVLVTT
jgi:predicted nucleic acid-binding protein